MFTIALGLNGPDEAIVVTKDEVSPQILSLPLVRVVIPKPNFIDSLGPLRIVLKEPLAEDFKGFAFALFTKVLLKGCNELIECSQITSLPCSLRGQCDAKLKSQDELIKHWHGVQPGARTKKGPDLFGPATSGTLREEEYITDTSKP
jgi:hypothetical protein